MLPSIDATISQSQRVSTNNDMEEATTNTEETKNMVEELKKELVGSLKTSNKGRSDCEIAHQLFQECKGLPMFDDMTAELWLKLVEGNFSVVVRCCCNVINTFHPPDFVMSKLGEQRVHSVDFDGEDPNLIMASFKAGLASSHPQLVFQREVYSGEWPEENCKFPNSWNVIFGVPLDGKTARLTWDNFHQYTYARFFSPPLGYNYAVGGAYWVLVLGPLKSDSTMDDSTLSSRIDALEGAWFEYCLQRSFNYRSLFILLIHTLCGPDDVTALLDDVPESGSACVIAALLLKRQLLYGGGFTLDPAITCIIDEVAEPVKPAVDDFGAYSTLLFCFCL